MSKTENTSSRLTVPILGVLVLAVLIGCGTDEVGDPVPPPETPEGHETITVEGVGFENPRSVIHDPLTDVYLVSNMNGGPLRKDGNGFISRVAPTGNVEDLRWIEGDSSSGPLNAPKGMVIRGDTLFVADIDCVRMFHRATGGLVGSVCPPGATNLNGLTVDEAGTIFLTDSGFSGEVRDTEGSAIYSIDTEGVVRELFRGRELGEPRGIAASDRGVFFASLRGGSISQLGPEKPRLVVRGWEDSWQLDGMFFAPNGSFAFSNWGDSTVLLVQAKAGGARGEVFTLVSGVPFAGGIGYDAQRQWAIIPMLFQNRLLLLEIWPEGGA